MEEEDDGRRMGELGSRMINPLKRNVSGMKHQAGGIFNTQVKNNVTGRVKELVLGFERMVGSDVNLKSRNHESRFKESIENAYLSPRKRRKVCQEVKNLPRHTARLSKPGTWPSSSPTFPRGSRLDTTVARTL